MGLVWSHGIKCNRLLLKKLIDNENWFGATLIEYNSLSSPIRDDWNLSLRRSYEYKSESIHALKRIFKKRTKCHGRISVHENCIVFQGLHCSHLMKAIISRQDRSPSSVDKSLSGSPTSFISEPFYYNSQSSTDNNDSQPADLDCLNTFVWPMHTIRHFGYKNDYFSFDSGRFSPTGEGRFTFKVKNASAFVTIFQKRYSQCSVTSPDTYSPMSSLSPYYNMAASSSYQNISQLSANKFSGENQYRLKSSSKSNEFTFDNNNNNHRNQSHDDSILPINYSTIDFSNGYVNAKVMSEGKPAIRQNRFDFTHDIRDSIYYLTICENQTKAVEEVLKRIESKKM